jgi:hypothetical protein
MTSLVPDTLSHRRRHRRQNTQFFGYFDVDKDTATLTSVTTELLPATNNPDTDADNIVSNVQNFRKVLLRLCRVRVRDRSAVRSIVRAARFS